jgi:hypothetical protein
VPLAGNVRITENAAEIKPGDGLFKTGGKSELQRPIVDPERCGILTQAVVDETTVGKSAPVLMVVRRR